MQTERTNASRAAEARVALNAFQATGGQAEDDETAIFDLIVDLLHLARRDGGVADHDLQRFVDRAVQMHNAEQIEDPEE